jgi:hypothetical protein
MPASVFDYAVIRVVPRVEREEFVNVGVILHSPERAFLGAALDLDCARDRLRALAPNLDLRLVERHLRQLLDICTGAPTAGPLAQWSRSERFHFIVAARSTIVQTSAVHAGLAEDLPATLDRLLQSTVR